MHISKKKVLSMCSSVLILTMMLSMTVFAAEKAPKPELYATFWALIPPVVAIALALITKEVYSSLFVGILVGALLYSGFSFEKTVVHIFEGGIISVLSDKYNVGILVFLVILGAMVSLMNRAGGSAAFGEWAGQHIKSRVGAQLATIALGVLIFIDDYFNCLTVGSVMRPVTDKHNVSRAKLSYLIDATAAPVCIIAPISSWAAAVTGFVEGEDGFSIFMQAIPYNFYALLTIVMMIGIVLLKADYGPMRTHEMNALKGDLYTTENRPYENVSEGVVNHNGKVIDLVIPILSLIVCCVIGMIYTGGFFDGVGFVEAFSNSDASVGLVLGSFFGLIITIALYVVRRVLNFSDCMSCIPEGFKAMVPAIMILTFAWTLKAMTDSLGAAEFVATTVEQFAGGLMNFLPAIIFLIGCFLAFATGTSWGTFGILIPIIIPVAQSICPELLLSSLAATLAGSVFGDHCSPISDTTILSSAGAGVNHLTHVSTQMIYALTVAGCSLIGYLIIGITNGNLLLSLGTSIFILCIFTFIMHRRSKTILNKKDICSTQQNPMLSL